MTLERTLSEFIKFSDDLTESCRAHPSIIGLVLVGSTAETFRVDEWSDHDFFVITSTGEQETLRQNLNWLPNHDQISFSFRETEHGLKVVYKSGAVLEFAIFDCVELANCGVNHNRLVYGNEDVEKALATAVSKPAAADKGDLLTDFRHFLSLILIGVGRARRGEVLTAGQGIRSYAAGSLLNVFKRHLGNDDRLDRMDPWRRFELVYPSLGKEFGDALAHSPETAAKNLLSLAENHLSQSWSEYPSAEVDVVRAALSWAS